VYIEPSNSDCMAPSNVIFSSIFHKKYNINKNAQGMKKGKKQRERGRRSVDHSRDTSPSHYNKGQSVNNEKGHAYL
jgi:hypothetical protein